MSLQKTCNTQMQHRNVHTHADGNFRHNNVALVVLDSDGDVEASRLSVSVVGSQRSGPHGSQGQAAAVVDVAPPVDAGRSQHITSRVEHREVQCDWLRTHCGWRVTARGQHGHEMCHEI